MASEKYCFKTTEEYPSCNYTISLDSMDFALLPIDKLIQKYQVKEAPVKIKIFDTINGLRLQSEPNNLVNDVYSQAEIEIEKLNEELNILEGEEDETDCRPLPSDLVKPCYLCRMQIPINHYKKHLLSETHKCYLKMAQACVDRLNESLKNDLKTVENLDRQDGNEPDNTISDEKKTNNNVIDKGESLPKKRYCMHCNESYKTMAYHESLPSHRINVKKTELLQKFETFFFSELDKIKADDVKTNKETLTVKKVLSETTNDNPVNIISTNSSKSNQSNDSVDDVWFNAFNSTLISEVNNHVNFKSHQPKPITETNQNKQALPENCNELYVEEILEMIKDGTISVNTEDNFYYCVICDAKLYKISLLKIHINSQRHKSNLKPITETPSFYSYITNKDRNSGVLPKQVINETESVKDEKNIIGIVNSIERFTHTTTDIQKGPDILNLIEASTMTVDTDKGSLNNIEGNYQSLLWDHFYNKRHKNIINQTNTNTNHVASSASHNDIQTGPLASKNDDIGSIIGVKRKDDDSWTIIVDLDKGCYRCLKCHIKNGHAMLLSEHINGKRHKKGNECNASTNAANNNIGTRIVVKYKEPTIDINSIDNISKTSLQNITPDQYTGDLKEKLKKIQANNKSLEKVLKNPQIRSNKQTTTTSIQERVPKIRDCSSEASLELLTETNSNQNERKQAVVTQTPNDESFYYCASCKVKVPNSDKNISEHLNGKSHNQKLKSRQENIYNLIRERQEILPFVTSFGSKENISVQNLQGTGQNISQLLNPGKIVVTGAENLNQFQKTKHSILQAPPPQSHSTSNIDTIISNSQKRLQQSIQNMDTSAPKTSKGPQPSQKWQKAELLSNVIIIKDSRDVAFGVPSNKNIQQALPTIPISAKDTSDDFYCTVCMFNISSNPDNIKIHNKSVRHKEQLKIRKKHLKEIKRISACAENDAAKSSTVENDINALKIGLKPSKPNDKPTINNDKSKVIKYIDYYCPICKVSVPNNPSNIKCHNNGAKHKKELRAVMNMYVGNQ